MALLWYYLLKGLLVLGIHNTSYERITVYVKKEHIDFLDDLISDLQGTKQTVPSRSELIRALLDKYCGSLDWYSKELYSLISEKGPKKRSNSKK